MSRPASPDAEAAVLGGLLLDPEQLPEVRATLGAEDFSDPRHANIWRAVVAVADSGTVPDLRTVEAELELSGLLDSSGGVAYLAGLDASLPDLGRLGSYARDVHDLARLRHLREAARKVANGAEPEDLERLREALAETPTADGLPTAAADYAALLADPSLTADPEAVARFIAYRRMLTLLAGREKQSGKTTLACCMAAAVSAGRPFLGRPTIAGPVVYAALDGPLAQYMRHFQRFRASEEPGRLVVLRRRVDPLRDLEAAVRHVRSVTPSSLSVTFVVDTMQRLVDHLNLDPGRAADWSPIMARLSELAEECDAAGVVNHHAAKATGEARDSTAITAGADLILTMKPDGARPTVRRVSVLGPVPVEPFSVEFVGDDFRLFDGTVSLDGEVLSYVMEHPECGKRAVRAGVNGKNADIDAALARLMLAGAVANAGDDRGHRYVAADGARSDEIENRQSGHAGHAPGHARGTRPAATVPGPIDIGAGARSEVAGSLDTCEACRRLGEPCARHWEGRFRQEWKQAELAL